MPFKDAEVLGRCTKRWCFVRLAGVIGWLSKDRFLTDAAVPPPPPSFVAALPFLRPKKVEDESAKKTVDIALPVRKGAPPSVQKVVEVAMPVRKSSALPSVPTLPVAAILKSPQLAISRIEQKRYGLKELGSRVFLSVYEDRTESSRVAGTIPFFATDVEAIGLCIDGWCVVRYEALEGWVRQHHLTDEPETADPRLQLEPIMPVDVLNVYSTPNDAAKIVAKLKPPVTNIKPLDSCDEQWCQIRYFDTVGWVRPKYLTRQ